MLYKGSCVASSLYIIMGNVCWQQFVVCIFPFIMYSYTQCVFYCSCYILFEIKLLSNSGHHVFAKDEAQLQGSGNRLITAPAAA